MDDITPALLAAVKEAFDGALQDNKQAKELLEAIMAGSAVYPDAAAYAEEVGQALADAFAAALSSETLPEGRMYWNIADRVVRPMLEEDHQLVSSAAVKVQQALNQRAGLGLQAQAAALDNDRVEGILNKITAAERYDDVAWVLNEPVKTFSRAVVDETLRRNVDFQGKAGLRPRVIRRAEAHCCEWCSKLDGTYSYPDVPRDVYRRHERCRCVVEYDPGSGKCQGVWSKAWTDDPEEIERRKNIQGIDTQARIREPVQNNGPKNVMPEYLRTATPGVGTITYDEGYSRTRHAEEIKTAQWLHDNLGGDIVLLQEKGGLFEKTPDFRWREKGWELKTTTSAKSADSALRSALKQIAENPGGVILNYNDNDVPMDKVLEIVTRRLLRQEKCNADILIVQKGNLVAALRYKK